MGTPSETASFLATSMSMLVSVAIKEGDGKELHESYREQDITNRASAFLDAFRSSLTNVVPYLSQYKRDAPVGHAGEFGASYHELTCLLGRSIYTELWIIVDLPTFEELVKTPHSGDFDGITGQEVTVEAIIDEWPNVASSLWSSYVGTPVEGKRLASGIKTDPLSTAGKADPKLITPKAKTVAVIQDMQKGKGDDEISENHHMGIATVRATRSKLKSGKYHGYTM